MLTPPFPGCRVVFFYQKAIYTERQSHIFLAVTDRFTPLFFVTLSTITTKTNPHKTNNNKQNHHCICKCVYIQQQQPPITIKLLITIHNGQPQLVNNAAMGLDLFFFSPNSQIGNLALINKTLSPYILSTYHFNYITINLPTPQRQYRNHQQW